MGLVISTCTSQDYGVPLKVHFTKKNTALPSILLQHCLCTVHLIFSCTLNCVCTTIQHYTAYRDHGSTLCHFDMVDYSSPCTKSSNIKKENILWSHQKFKCLKKENILWSQAEGRVLIKPALNYSAGERYSLCNLSKY